MERCARVMMQLHLSTIVENSVELQFIDERFGFISCGIMGVQFNPEQFNVGLVELG